MDWPSVLLGGRHVFVPLSLYGPKIWEGILDCKRSFSWHVLQGRKTWLWRAEGVTLGLSFSVGRKEILTRPSHLQEWEIIREPLARLGESLHIRQCPVWKHGTQREEQSSAAGQTSLPRFESQCLTWDMHLTVLSFSLLICKLKTSKAALTDF